eukprot:TRINITY_DN108758_c0_g1_i1.p1 TRINITY_DN108758_c0_g1~~TRINITY_DN108758_c0_g1_i1.p1  ORF type:complete len:739 (-),score=43.07 TRINITY_DN108758_c0_g1_i1:68-2185(-)
MSFEPMRAARLPTRHEMQREALLIDRQILRPVLDKSGFKFDQVSKGDLWDFGKSRCAELSLYYFQCEGSNWKELLGDTLIMSVYRALQGPGRMTNGIFATMIKKEQYVSGCKRVLVSIKNLGEEVLESKIDLFCVESISFHGTIKTSSGLHTPCVVHLSCWECSLSEEIIEDRFVRMQSYIKEGAYMSVLRNLISLVRPYGLVRIFKQNRSRFSTKHFQDQSQLLQQAKSTRDFLVGCINKHGRLESFERLLASTLDVVPEQELNTYCKKHFGITDLTRGELEDLQKRCFERLSKIGKKIVHESSASAMRVMPTYVKKLWRELLQSVPEPKMVELTWTTTHVASTAVFKEGFDSPDGDETVFLVELKHCRITDLLKNLGFDLFSSTPEGEMIKADKYVRGTQIKWKSDSDLTEAQLELKEVARQMGLKSCDSSNPESQTSGALPIPHPSVSPAYMDGAIAFLTPLIARDLFDMVGYLRQEGYQVKTGHLIVSKNLLPRVMSVVNPRREEEAYSATATRRDAGLERANNAGFERRRTVVEMVGSPGNCFRYQGIKAARMLATSARQSSSLPGASTTNSLDARSMETRPTKTTGDLPQREFPGLGSLCDKQSRPPLRGHVRHDGLHLSYSSMLRRVSAQESTRQNHHTLSGMHRSSTAPHAQQGHSLTCEACRISDFKHHEGRPDASSGSWYCSFCWEKWEADSSGE